MTLREMAEKDASLQHGPAHRDPAHDCRECSDIADAIERVARAFADTCLDNRGQGDDVHCGDHDGALGWCKECRDAVIENAEKDA